MFLQTIEAQLASADHAPDPTPRSIKNWNLERELGDGAFARVKRATNVATKQQAAVKIINLKQLAQTSRAKEMRIIRKKVMKEIRILRSLKHPNIIEFFEVVEIANRIFIVMELAQGGEMFDYIATRGKLSEKRARYFFRQLVSALEYCHAHMIVHRDLKLENLLLDDQDNLKLTDFGLSNSTIPGQLLMTNCGSAQYVAPEVLQGSGYIGFASDIWSLGIILFAFVFGVLPFSYCGDDYARVYEAAIQGKLYFPNKIGRDCEDLILKLLKPDPKARATMSDIKHHPWTVKGYDMPPPCWLKKYPPVAVPDPEIIMKLTFYGFRAEHVISLLKRNDIEPCQEVTMYHFLVKQMKEKEQRRLTKQNRQVFDGAAEKQPIRTGEEKLLSPAKHVSAKAVAVRSKPELTAREVASAPSSPHRRRRRSLKHGKKHKQRTAGGNVDSAPTTPLRSRARRHSMKEKENISEESYTQPVQRKSQPTVVVQIKPTATFEDGMVAAAREPKPSDRRKRGSLLMKKKKKRERSQTLPPASKASKNVASNENLPEYASVDSAPNSQHGSTSTSSVSSPRSQNSSFDEPPDGEHQKGRPGRLPGIRKTTKRSRATRAKSASVCIPHTNTLTAEDSAEKEADYSNVNKKGSTGTSSLRLPKNPKRKNTRPSSFSSGSSGDDKSAMKGIAHRLQKLFT